MLSCIFLVDLLSNDHLRSNLSHAHETHLTHAQASVNDNNNARIMERFILGYS